MGVDFKEYAGCPKYIYDYDDINMDGYYDTGFDKNSAEFRGLTPEEINKRLEDRKELIEYFKIEVSKTGKTESEFLDTYSLELKHNTIIDTSDMSQRLKLYFAMRGNRITPEGEEGNEVVYGKSMYKLVDREEKENTKAKFAKMSHEVKHWLHKNLEKESTKKTVYNVLTYLNWMKPLSKSEDYILSEMVEEKIKSVDALEKINRVINSIPEKELALTTDIATSSFLTALDGDGTSGNKIVYANLGDQIRIAGFADANLRPEKVSTRIQTLLEVAQRNWPNIAHFDRNIETWTQFRPMTPSGVPIIGETKIKGLYLNGGHGSLGYTFAPGSAMKIAGLIGHARKNKFDNKLNNLSK